MAAWKYWSAALGCAVLLTAGAQVPSAVPATPFRLGAQALQNGDWAAAVRQFELCRKEHPGDAELLFYLAQAYYKNGAPAQALTVISQASKLAPANAQIAQKHGEYLCDAEVHCSAGLTQLLHARKLDPTLDDIDFDIGMAKFRMGQIEAARASFESELRRNPRHADSAFYLGEVTSRIAERSASEQEWKKARSYYERAIRDGGERGTYCYGLGRSMVASGEFEAAIPVLTKALQLDPEQIEAHFQLGKALRSLGREAEGVHELEVFRAVRDRLNLPSTLVPVQGLERQRVWEELGALAAAQDRQPFLDRVRQLDGRGNLWLRAGAVYCVLSRPSQALQALERARQEEPANAEVRAWVGRVRLLERNFAAAETEFQEALRLEERNQTALAGLGELRYRQQRWSEAVRYLEDAQSKQPETLLALCDAYLHLGDKENALVTAELIRVFAPDNQPVQNAVQRLLNQAR
ncbi:MAG: tetratricopeptide repeat protein [Bryobacteraceae bacterium]|nr:tetratricopeptide repeat protein [Bryobacteraceae bacterium]